jgi:hypothetical protein
VDRYSDPYGYRLAHVCRYAAGNLNSDAFPHALSTHPDALADGHPDADALADADVGSHAHAYTDLAFDDL